MNHSHGHCEFLALSSYSSDLLKCGIKNKKLPFLRVLGGLDLINTSAEIT